MLTPASTFGGIVYYDQNSNGAFDAGESSLFDIPIYLQSPLVAQIERSTNPNYFRLSSGDFGPHELGVSGVVPYIITEPASGTYNYDIDSFQLFEDHNFGIQVDSTLVDIAPEIIATEEPRPGRLVSFIVALENLGAANSCSFSLELDSLSDFVSAIPVPDSIGLATLHWNIDFPDPFIGDQVELTLRIDSGAAIGDSIQLLASTLSDPVDLNPANSLDTLIIAIVNSFDPNDKLAQPEGIGVEHIIPPWTSELTYTIRFQNTGTASALDVYILDTLNAQFFDVSGFRVLASSHEVEYEFNGPSLRFDFPDIVLPDSISDPEGSQGFVSFKIPIREDLPLGTEILNKAYIFFDLNEPIETPPAIRVIDLLFSSIDEIDGSMQDNLQLSPNPSSGIFSVEWMGEKYDKAIAVFSLSGQLIELREMNSSLTQFDLSGQQAGTYLLAIYDSSGVLASQKLTIVR
jgi:hypothetical protein